jgi:3-oxoacyl-[acyl-carrier protein] reductase
MSTLQAKTALVTGVGRLAGIGAAIARELAAGGASVYITYHHAYDEEMPWTAHVDEPDQFLQALRAEGVQAAGEDMDLSLPATPALLFDAAEAALGPVDILVNNATYSTRDGIDALDAATLDRHYAVNVRGMMLLCAEFVRRFSGKEGGRIINLTSGQGLGPMPGELAYVATKGAVDAFTLSLSAEVADRGITVNAIDPGITDTGWIDDALRKHFLREAPMGRIGTPADAARLVAFLASEDAAWITGQVIRSRGGL